MEKKTKMTLKNKIIQSYKTRWDKRDKVRAPSIKKLADFIKMNSNYIVEVKRMEDVWKDTQISGTRFRNAGIREYVGYRLIIKDKTGKLLLDHDTTETYRYNFEICYWIIENILKIDIYAL